MESIKKKVISQFRRGAIDSNLECSYYPCHFYDQNCTHCFCPFYPCEDEELGTYITGRTGKRVWSCQQCYWIHRDDVAKECIGRFDGKDWGSMPMDDRLKIKAEIEQMHFKSARPLMVLGTTSGAGKSLIVAALCRIFSDMGYTVTPYKSQNMSLNSFVTKRGEEIARIQDLQARAARVEPRSQMNPILLKPLRDDVSQVIVYGVPYGDMDVGTYYNEFIPAKGNDILRSSLKFLAKTNDIIIMEGAGSPAEINISEFEIANLKAAEVADAPCILVVNIERGGAFAYLYGTVRILDEGSQKMIKGAIINNMRGDPDSLSTGIREIEKMLDMPVLGIVPHLDLDLPSEDSMDIRDSPTPSRFTVGVVRLPRISNFTDFDALNLMEDIKVRYINAPSDASGVDALILPGTKSTIEDLIWLREKGFEKVIRELHGKVPIFGICGGYQMLGKSIIDINSIESDTKETEGLGLLNGVTYFDKYEKSTAQVEGHLQLDPLKRRIRGYEIHMGQTENKLDPPLNRIRAKGKNREDGAYDADMKVYGTYLHGFFDLPPARDLLLSLMGSTEREKGEDGDEGEYDDIVERNLGYLADAIRASIDLESLRKIMGVRP
ncbi:MAG TPA: cobyric acid synthase [Candidatus Methanofastidiosa archaeon]|nr:cobyric acid synthase [Candidatus Methanofastidiosa archaeon]HPR42054.1 cobyric acid synthase [Candidatus Methanofastidiosa archaeon]